MLMAEAQGLAQQPARNMNRMNESEVAVGLGGHRPVLRTILRREVLSWAACQGQTELRMGWRQGRFQLHIRNVIIIRTEQAHSR